MTIKKMITIALLIINLFTNISYSNDINQEFDKLYRKYEILRVKEGYRSVIPGGNKICEISELGPQVIPLFIRKVEEKSDDRGLLSAFRFLWVRTTRKIFDPALMKSLQENRDRASIFKMYKDWWFEGRKNAQKQYQVTYENWRECKKEGNKEKADLALRQIRDMGRIVLPFLLTDLKKGDKELLPIVQFLSHKSLKTAGIDECVAWCEANREKWYIEIPKNDGEDTKEN